ncbi:DUF6804 family protein [Pedobacter punctiformis]|uniref:Uncharacterized protein n=1 Tax=Pedobacter punctiformis TaxID=3004097 RepID=A0ABT4LBH0_9SPHI|nr:DUF6804 family protein [Pedobacter sp. HCMS5-2]MCZ4245260.1 hypothetical protein [Pedobacter sp. HCMS5-2]
MKSLFILCSASCFIATLKLPIEYYTFLRIVISLGSILMIYDLLNHKNYSWIIVFVAVFIFFNPVFPIYLHRKSIWLPFDIATGILFLLLAFLRKKDKVKEEKNQEPLSPPKLYTRDHIIVPKPLKQKEN